MTYGPASRGAGLAFFTLVGITSLLLVLATASVEIETRPAPTVVAESTHFVFFARDKSQVDVARNERFVERLERRLGFKVAGRAQYHRYEHQAEIAVVTGTYASGVTFAGSDRIYSTHAAHFHEIVHWVVGGLGNPGPFFQEGVAVALSEEERWRSRSLRTLASRGRSRGFRAFLEGFDNIDLDEAYPVAGAFVSELIREHGLGRVIEFLRAAGRQGNALAFREAFGRELVAYGETWLASL